MTLLSWYHITNTYYIRLHTTDHVLITDADLLSSVMTQFVKNTSIVSPNFQELFKVNFHGFLLKLYKELLRDPSRDLFEKIIGNFYSRFL